jgi:hypothetical protein
VARAERFYPLYTQPHGDIAEGKHSRVAAVRQEGTADLGELRRGWGNGFCSRILKNKSQPFTFLYMTCQANTK